jgi:hypothetical protein
MDVAHTTSFRHFVAQRAPKRILNEIKYKEMASLLLAMAEFQEAQRWRPPDFAEFLGRRYSGVRPSYFPLSQESSGTWVRVVFLGCCWGCCLISLSRNTQAVALCFLHGPPLDSKFDSTRFLPCPFHFIRHCRVISYHFLTQGKPPNLTANDRPPLSSG